MELSAAGGGLRLRLSSADTGELLVYDVDANGNLTLADIDALPTNGVAAEELSAITVGGEELLVAVVPLSASVSQLVAFNPVTGQTYDFADAGNRVTSIAVVSVGGSEFVYVAYADGSPIDCFEREAGGDFALAGAVSPGVGVGIAGLQVVEVAGRTLLIVSDYSGNIHSFGVSPDGSLTLIDSEGAGEGLGISGPAEAECVTLDGVTYVIQAATGSSSLSVLRIESDGSLTPTDHVIDSQNTRFQSVTAMDAVTVNGHVYLIVGGADGGISLLKLLPGGTLYHLGKIVDTTTTTLSAINSIEAAVVGGTIQVFVSSGDSAGFTQITLTPGPVGTTKVGTGGADTVTGTSGDDVLAGGDGADLISGGSGDDFLLDGAGVDTLTGGSGADVFVLTYDQGVDVIMDFDRTKDRLDLSAFPLLRNVDQLQITPMPWGARIVYCGEVLDVHTVDGLPLTAAQIASFGVVNLDHYMGLDALVGLDLDGTDGNDILEGTQMQDSLRGHLGDDVFRGRGGGDYLDGGGGRDFVDYAGASAAVTINLAEQSQNAGGAQGDTLIGIEGVVGTTGADVLCGDAVANFLYGEAGNDRLYGGGGNDELHGGDGNDRLSGGVGADLIFGGTGRDFADFSASPSVTLDFLRPELNTGEARGDVYVDVEGAIGGDGRDTLRGGNDTDFLFGGGNEDVLVGRGGDDHLYGDGARDLLMGNEGADVLHGGGGRDWALYSQSPVGLVIDMLDPTQSTGEAYGDIFIQVEGIGGTFKDDTILGDNAQNFVLGRSGDDHILGRGGDDHLYGEDGRDTLEGGAGNDVLSGGGNADTFVFDGGNDLIIDFNDDIDTLVLDSELWGGGPRTVTELLAGATMVNGAVVIDFGDGDSLTVRGADSVEALIDDIVIL